jgi:hypothetical protein
MKLLPFIGSLINSPLTDPIIILGSGRCGSSLLKRILDSHDQIIGYPNEANFLWHPNSYPFPKRTIETPAFVEDPAGFSRLSVKNWPANYPAHISKVFSDYFREKTHCKKKLALKSAMISFILPEIYSIFPNAKIIHIYRSGPSVIESFLIKEWSKYDSYFKDKEEYLQFCAKYWNDTIIELDHQKRLLHLTEKNFFELSYEQLCAESTETIKSLSDFLDISSHQFRFDFSSIKSTNDKVGNYSDDDDKRKLFEIMSPAMLLKGYI